jgi:hypothetical protein
MKQPQQGIRSTTPKTPRLGVPVTVPDPVMPNLEEYSNDDDNNDSRNTPHFNLMDNINDHSIANVFCFGAFATKFQVSFTTTAQANSHTCPSMKTFVFS